MLQLGQGRQRAVQRLPTFDGQRLRLLLDHGLPAFRRGDVIGDDLNHIDVGNELIQQPLQGDQRTPHRGDAARYLDAMTGGKLGERGKERSDIQLGQIDLAVFLHDHVKIVKQRRVILGIRTRVGEAQQAVRQSRRILLGDREEHILEHGAGALIQTPRHTKVDKHNLPAAHDDVARVWVGMEEALVQNLRGVIVDQLGANLLQIVAGREQLLGVRDGNAVDVIHHHHMLGAQLRVGRRAIHVLVWL